MHQAVHSPALPRPVHTLRPLRAAALAAALQVIGLVSMAALVPDMAQAQSAARQEQILGVGDVIRITVYQSPDLSMETRIADSGVISYPLLGQVKLGGLSVMQAEKVLTDGLRNGNFLKAPQVNILLMQVRSAQANALGMVGKPGRYPLDTAGLRLSDVLAMAGGVAPGGADVVSLSGQRNGQPFRRQFDVAVLSSGNSNEDPMIQNGDTVFVDRMPQVYMYGEVQRPGVTRLERNMTVMQALAAGGGLTLRGTEKGIKVHRTLPGGKVEVLEPALTDAVRDGDVIHVRQSLF